MSWAEGNACAQPDALASYRCITNTPPISGLKQQHLLSEGQKSGHGEAGPLLSVSPRSYQAVSWDWAYLKAHLGMDLFLSSPNWVFAGFTSSWAVGPRVSVPPKWLALLVPFHVGVPTGQLTIWQVSSSECTGKRGRQKSLSS